MSEAAHPVLLVAAFRSPDELESALDRLAVDETSTGDTYTPTPRDEGSHDSRIRPAMAVAFLLAAGGALALQGWSAISLYAVNSGGRPLGSWPAFIPTAFEIGVLAAALAGAVGFVVEAGLGRLHRPIFDAALSAAASHDAYLLTLETPAAQAHDLHDTLRAAGAHSFEELRR